MEALMRTDSRRLIDSSSALDQATHHHIAGRPVSRFAGQRVHFIGIGGCGMSGLAHMLMDAGAVVSGSDPKLNEATAGTEWRGATVSAKQDGGLITEDVQWVVRTAAVPDSNPEYRKAQELGLNQVKYAQMLGEVMRERLGVAVSGTHGKTTTTSMISFALVECGLDPSFVIGGTVEQLGGSSRSGGGRAFVVEACEFDRSFHALWPAVGVITNIEADHLDFYTNGIEEIVESFRVFARRVPETGRIIANGQDGNVRRSLNGVKAAIDWVGLNDISGMTWAGRSEGIESGCHIAAIYHLGELVNRVRLSVPGMHNVFNATAAVAACAAAGLDAADAAEAVSRFRGADRRMTKLGEVNGAVVVDDYGHHPTEIRTTLRALREKYEPRRLICVFQPHQHSRTRHFIDDFSTSFDDADLTVVPEIYAARDSEDDRRSVCTADLVERIEEAGRPAIYLPKLSEVVDFLKDEARTGDLIVTMGAGDVCEVGRELVRG
jgi:UDP-N-acetylmuramate--alanine ligase